MKKNILILATLAIAALCHTACKKKDKDPEPAKTTAVAEDSTKEEEVSEVVVIKKNTAPTATLTGESIYGTGSENAFEVSASDADGTIARIDFYEGNNYVGSSTTNPATFYYTTSKDGNYSFKAIVYDNKGASATSNVINGVAYYD